MKERPILFSTPMVKAILDGKKTVTRRIIKFALNGIHIDRILGDWPLSEIGEIEGDFLHYEAQCDVDDSVKLKVKCPYGKIGDRLWVRETWNYLNSAPINGHPQVCYKADDRKDLTGSADGTKAIWRPSIHMPRWTSRITLEITDVRCERLLEIKENDAIKEGFLPSNGFTARGNFLKLFGELNGNESITNNVYVWVIEFVKL